MPLQAGAYAILLARLLFSRLVRSYPFFFTFVAFEMIRTASMAAIPARSDRYAELYFFTQPIAWVLHALTCLEVFQVSLKSHPGIATLGRRAVTVAIFLATLISVVSALSSDELPKSPYVRLEQFILLERVITSSLLVFLMTLLSFLAYFPVPISRNALWHAGLFGLYLLTKTGLWVARTLTGPEFTTTMNAVMNVIILATLMTWILALSREGERKVVTSRTRADKAEEERLMLQLEQLNRTLSRSGRK